MTDTLAPSFTIQRWLDCEDCGQPFFRSRRFTTAEDADQWQPEPRCGACLLALRDECE